MQTTQLLSQRASALCEAAIFEAAAGDDNRLIANSSPCGVGTLGEKKKRPPEGGRCWFRAAKA
jgi:hypothetical protein